ncbi:class I SAM-dependent methyltransferase [Kitasatospora viridis]|uniref:Methyltransferase family protein n=1 Tax=Kitasatospora viridis TaxID=281105 RepID=A0A561UFR3_9ACTN|nr:class I SAM-dependent methyltransferase [Kitasatospora viridis]TWF98186.1 methyltransferase family protein [Kitasatospora viridis]
MTGEQRERTRQGYDTVAEEYRRRIGGELAGKPLDRALLGALLEQAEPGAPVADLGCGPGHVAGWLAAAGARVVGVDLSPAMVELAGAAHPAAEFRVGDLCGLPAADGEFGAAVVLYSVIHLTADELGGAFAELHRVLRPGGRALIAFHLGDQVVRLTEWWGHRVAVDFHHHGLATVAGELERAGFAVEVRLEREPYPAEAPTRRGYLVARRQD